VFYQFNHRGKKRHKETSYAQEEMVLLRTLKGHADSVVSVSFSADSKYLASGSGDDTIKILDDVSALDIVPAEKQPPETKMLINRPVL